MTASAPLNRRECLLLATVLLLLLIALAAPALPAQALALGAFADQRPWQGVANAMDVLSNLPFAALGLWGLWQLRRFDAAATSGAATEPPGSTLDCAWLFFAGLLVTAAGSAFYHLQPDAVRLAADRAGMAVAFAGLVGMAACERVSQRAGWVAAWCTLLGGLAAVACAAEADNLLPWGAVQFGGMAIVLALAFTPKVDGAIGLRLGWVIAFYAAAKLLEAGDAWVYEATGHLVSGHTLKHGVAALAALPVLAALQPVGAKGLRHNPGAAAATA
ncbi:Uncharacterised protein [Xylophilus ampelinus]|nr:hypothetical protein [Variovorax sp.]VTY36356.1 Uncharacterised protein [Xylophilus ampelinus]